MVKKFYWIFAIFFALAFLVVTVNAGFVAFAEEGIEGEQDEAEEYFDPRSMVEKIDCAHAKYAVEGSMRAGDTVEISLSKFDEGYALDYVLVSCDGTAIVTSREGNRISFKMPEKPIRIKVVFKQAEEVTAKKPLLGTKEIIAVSVAGAIVLAGGIFIFLKNFKKRGAK